MYLNLKEKDVANVLSVVGRKAGEYILPRDESCLSLLQYQIPFFLLAISEAELCQMM